MTIKNLTRKDWLLGELYGKNLHSSMNVNQYKKYALLAKGVVFTAEVDGCLRELAGDELAGGTHPRSRGRDIHRNRSGSCCRAAFQRRGREGCAASTASTCCASDPDDKKPVVMFKLDHDVLNRKELLFNVI